MATSNRDDDARFVPPDLADDAARSRSSVELPAGWDAKVRVAQVIHAALVVGVGLFLAVVAFLQASGSLQGQAGLATLGWALPLGLGVAGAFAAPQFRRVAIAAARAQPAAAADRFAQSSILVGAIIEGPALLAAVMGLLSGSGLPLVVGAALVLLLAIQFPTRARAMAFLGD